MNSDVKRLFKRETQGLRKPYNDSNFDELFFAFCQLVEYDVEVAAVEGLRERLPYALSKIASEKIDRNDVITFFPIIWGKFESFIRKLLFIYDRGQYEIMATDRKNTLKSYLDSLNISINTNVAEYKQNSITITYNVRNCDSHTCEVWSLEKFYYYLGHALNAYLSVVEKILPKIKKEKERTPSFAKLNLIYSNPQKIVVNPTMQRYGNFFNVSEFNKEFLIISDKNGQINTRDYSTSIPTEITENENNKKDPRIKYEFSGTRVIKKVFLYSFWNGNKDRKVVPEIIYEYDEDGQLSRILSRDYRPRLGEYTKTECLIDYDIDGSIVITKNTYHTPESTEEKEPRLKACIRRKYDPQGRIVEFSDNEGAIERYQYREDGLLEQITTRNGIFIEVEYLGDEVLFSKKRLVDETGHLCMKYIYENGKINRLIFYEYDKQTDSPLEKDTWTLVYE